MNRTRFLRIALETGLIVSFEDLENDTDVCFSTSDFARFYENVMRDCVALVEAQRCHKGVERTDFFKGHDQAIEDCLHTIKAHGALE